MNDYWGIPEKEYEISLLQFAREELCSMGYSVLGEKLEVCSGAGAVTLTAILVTGGSRFGLYIHDGPKRRKSRGPPVIRVLSLLPDMKNVEDVRRFVILHPDDFETILMMKDDKKQTKQKAEDDLKKVYTLLYDSYIKDLYETDISSAADVLRVRLRKDI